MIRLTLRVELTAQQLERFFTRIAWLSAFWFIR